MEEANDTLQKAMRASDPSTTKELMDHVLPSLETKVVLANKEPDVRLVVSLDPEDDDALLQPAMDTTMRSSSSSRTGRYLASSIDASVTEGVGARESSSKLQQSAGVGRRGGRGGHVVLYAHAEKMAQISKQLSQVIRSFQEAQVNDTVAHGLEVRGGGEGSDGAAAGAEGEEGADEGEDEEEKEFKRRCVEIRISEGSREHTDHFLRKLKPYVAIRPRHVQEALHILYNPEERIGGLEHADPATEADVFIGTFHFLVKYGVRHVGVLKRIRESLGARPSIACLLLTRAYGFCDKPPEEHLFDLEKFLFSELSQFRDEELRKFRFYNILDKETQLKIANMRIRSLEHLFKDPGIFWKPHFRDRNEKRVMPWDAPKTKAGVR